MAKKYAIETAEVHCQYGSESSHLKPWPDRHIMAESAEKLMANETDIGASCFPGGFGSCRSPHCVSLSVDVRENFKSQQQFAALDGFPTCSVNIALNWQNTKPDVYIGKGKALLEDGWTFCSTGLALISLDTSGQTGENKAEKIMAQYEELEDFVNAYIEANGLDPSIKEELMESVLLWHGYEPLPWEYKTSPTTRAFCEYLQKENPYLFNFFERGLYLDDGAGGTIDLTYMMGMTKAFKEGVATYYSGLNIGTVEDQGQFNAFLEAFRPENRENRSATRALEAFMRDYKHGMYDPATAAEEFLNFPTENPEMQSAVDRVCREIYYLDPETTGAREKNEMWIKTVMQSEQDSFGYGEMGDTSVTDAFFTKLHNALGE